MSYSVTYTPDDPIKSIINIKISYTHLEQKLNTGLEHTYTHTHTHIINMDNELKNLNSFFICYDLQVALFIVCGTSWHFVPQKVTLVQLQEVAL